MLRAASPVYKKNKFIMKNYLLAIQNTNNHDIEISIGQNNQNQGKQNKNKHNNHMRLSDQDIPVEYQL